jgi:tetratricopeptide (TPR) repeat protein
MKRILAFVLLIAFTVISVNAQTADPTNAFRAGLAAYQSGDYALAVTQYNIAIAQDPTRGYFYYNRGLALTASGNTAGGLADFQKSNELNPSAQASYQMAMIYYQNKQMDAAKAAFENAKMIKDDLDAMNFYLGMIYFKQNDFEDGEKCFSLYTEHVKNNPEAYYFRGFCEAKNGKYPEAIKSLKYALMYKDRDWKFYYKMYEVYDALNDKQNALNNISMVIEIGEHKPEYYEIRSKLYTDMGDEYRASEDMAKARELQQTGAATK